MKLIAFILSLISYSFIILFFYFIFLHKPPREKTVFIHTAVVTKNFDLKKINSFKKTVNFSKPKKSNIKKEQTKKLKTGSKSAFTKGGNVNFNDIFKNVKYNVPTKKINLKKQMDISRFKGKILKQLEGVKNISANISYKTSSKLSKGKINELINKIYEIWNNISFIPGEYAIIKFINTNGRVQVLILDSNLDLEKQNELIEKIQNIKYDKNIEITIKFQTKVNK